MRLRSFPVLLTLIATTAACEEKPTNTGKDTVDELQVIRDAMCECKDTPCANAVLQRYEAFVSANLHKKGDKYAIRRAERLMKELESCLGRADLKTATAEKKKQPIKRFPVDRLDPQISLANMVPGFKEAEGGHVFELAFDATINRQMAFSHRLMVHSRCVGGERPRTDEWVITGKALEGDRVGETVSKVAKLYGDKPLGALPKSCTVSFRVGGAPADFERICVRGTEITPDECADEAATPAQYVPAQPAK